MPRRSTLALAVASALLLLAWPAATLAGQLSVSANCTAEGTIQVHWTLTEWDFHPTGHPEWTGYDIMRRSADDCGAYVRVNAEPFPRTLNVSESFTYTETPPETGKLFEYHILLVDADRNSMYIYQGDCECAGAFAWASCPQYSAPVIQGTLVDWEWTFAVAPCAGTCYMPAYFGGAAYPEVYDELRPYVGTGTAFKFYGNIAFGSIEGPSLYVDHYEMADCATVDAARTSWGRLKIIYR